MSLIDPRTVRPFDWQAVRNSVARTGRLLVVEESSIAGNVAGEIVARMADRGSARRRRLCMPDVIHPYSASLERALLPDRRSIVAAANELLAA